MSDLAAMYEAKWLAAEKEIIRVEGLYFKATGRWPEIYPTQPEGAPVTDERPYTTAETQHMQIDKGLTNHAIAPENLNRVLAIREQAIELGHLLIDICPGGRDLSLALTALEDLTMRAVRAIALGQLNMPPLHPAKQSVIELLAETFMASDTSS